MNKTNPVVEEIKELARKIAEKIEGLTIKESFEYKDLMQFYRDVRWFIEPPCNPCANIALTEDKKLK